ncbi:hypothetical protein TNCV_2904571 [Trichonephila clavipes]|nr:hypothetical protein TNCV_2904571 [Trichonephila clavipes]
MTCQPGSDTLTTGLPQPMTNAEQKYMSKRTMFHTENKDFTPRGVKTVVKVIKTRILEPIEKHLILTLFNGNDWTFQQNSAPAHKAKAYQWWLRENEQT